MSRNMRDKMRREAYVTNEIIIRTELLKAKGKLFETGENTIGQGQNVSKSENVDTGDITDGRILNMWKLLGWYKADLFGWLLF